MAVEGGGTLSKCHQWYDKLSSTPSNCDSQKQHCQLATQTCLTELPGLRLLLLLWRPALPDAQRMYGLQLVLQSAVDLLCPIAGTSECMQHRNMHARMRAFMGCPHQAMPLQ